MKLNFYHLGVSAAFLGLGLMPGLVLAAPTLELTPVANSDEGMIVELSLSGLEVPVNAATGEIQFWPAGTIVTAIDQSHSAFTLWPETPTYWPVDQVLRFTGGQPGGLKSSTAALFRVTLQVPAGTTLTGAKVKHFNLLSNDGQGSRLALNQTRLLPAKSTTPDWSQNQTVPKIKAELLHYPYMYDNRYFIAFGEDGGATTPLRYEVREGSEPFVPATSPFLLRDQSLQSRVWVKAIAGADEARVIRVAGTGGFRFTWKLLLGLAVLAVVIIGFIKRRR